ncbi:unnamed protein product [Pleuronectes platessa]|uniref:Uncharacterized protein n=1 Tax=Pleuronectes platessa TaxID=8262 RepID=A0A9N7YDI9_PLEPL|nr:unnamed protein product [Pleuronectes platessa]
MIAREDDPQAGQRRSTGALEDGQEARQRWRRRLKLRRRTLEVAAAAAHTQGRLEELAAAAQTQGNRKGSWLDLQREAGTGSCAGQTPEHGAGKGRGISRTPCVGLTPDAETGLVPALTPYAETGVTISGTLNTKTGGSCGKGDGLDSALVTRLRPPPRSLAQRDTVRSELVHVKKPITDSPAAF